MWSIYTCAITSNTKHKTTTWGPQECVCFTRCVCVCVCVECVLVITKLTEVVKSHTHTYIHPHTHIFILLDTFLPIETSFDAIWMQFPNTHLWNIYTLTHTHTRLVCLSVNSAYAILNNFSDVNLNNKSVFISKRKNRQKISRFVNLHISK